MSLTVTIFSLAIAMVSCEKALNNYRKDPGYPPPHAITPEEIEEAKLDRWYVNSDNAECEHMVYSGAGGNHNNFASLGHCKNHLVITPDEQVDACDEPMFEGNCDTNAATKKREIRYYFYKGEKNGGANKCHMFYYNGCGGNGNNFKTEKQCEECCQNKKNGGVDPSFPDNELTDTPNSFDCDLLNDVDSDVPPTGYILDMNGRSCSLKSMKSTPIRGVFEDSTECVRKCVIPRGNYAEGCKQDKPHQQKPENGQIVVDDSMTKTFYYYHTTKLMCLEFTSLEHKGLDTKYIVGDTNFFHSIEICASHCNAEKNTGEIEAVDSCNLDKVGEVDPANTDESYKIERYYYNAQKQHPQLRTSGLCEKFLFHGRETNSNNFKSMNQCLQICFIPLLESSKLNEFYGLHPDLNPANTGNL